ncbi:hypothetical protein LTR53_002072 [Teratosphaeriaceae sp. CCFEE 6253]|nr:hypothetical protein LTR53_002072 [Teratosphaeriaceae sp. CCFEE 6253]
MVFGILSAVAIAPAIVGTTEAIRQGQKNNAREDHRGRKYHLSVTLLRRGPRREQFDHALVVLKDNKLYVDVRPDPPESERHHPVTGYFLPWPHGNLAEVWRRLGHIRGEGYVTTINEQNFLNWVYVDKQTHEVKYGVRAAAEAQKVGPWDCSKMEHRLTLDGWEGFVAVEEEEGSGLWALYFDVNDDGLRQEGQPGRKGKAVLQLEVWRKEIRKERHDAVRERFDRLNLRERSEEREEKTVDTNIASTGRGFEGRLQVQRDVADKTYAADFDTKLQQQRDISKGMFAKR